MTFQQSDIGPKYDFGLATRDGSVLSCLDENGNPQNLKQVAYMFSTKNDQVESTNLVRKEQLVRLSSANLIDREFTLYPKVSMGQATGGELQRIFTDATAYYQGRGVVFPWPGVWPVLPTAPITVQSQLTGQVRNPIDIGQLTNFGPCLAYGGSSPSGNPFTVWLAGNGVNISLMTPGNVQPWVMRFVSGTLYVGMGLASKTIYAVTYAGGVMTYTNVATLPQTPDLMTAGYVGSQAYLAVAMGETGTVPVLGTAIRLFSIPAGAGTALLATFTDIPIPPGTAVRAMTLLGSQLVYVVTDKSTNAIMSYSIPSGTSAVLAELHDYQVVRMAAVQGLIFVVAGRMIGTSLLNIDLFLLNGSSMQMIATLPPVIQGNNGGALSYNAPVALSDVAVSSSYAAFYVSISATTGVLFAYDVLRNALFRVTDTFGGATALQFDPPAEIGLTIGDGFDASGPGGINGALLIAVYDYGNGTANAAKVEVCTMAPLTIGFPTPTGGQVISSLIDFTSSQPKLWSQVTVNHPPLVGGQSVYLAAWLDQTPDHLTAAPTIAGVTNSTIGSTQTVLLVNRMAVKLVFELDWTGVTPISVVIQAATGWVWKSDLALSDSARINGQNPNQFCFTAQGQGIDAKAGYNFLRQLWRLKGGQCLLTLPDGDQYNAAIQSLDFKSPHPFALTFSADRKSRYESVCSIVVQEDL